MHVDVTTLDEIYSQEEITLSLRCLCDTRALRARRDYKPHGSALREELLRRQISASDRIPDRFYVISIEFLSLSRRRSSARNVPSGEERGETDVFAG